MVPKALPRIGLWLHAVGCGVRMGYKLAVEGCF